MENTKNEQSKGNLFLKFENFVHTLPSGREVLYRCLSEDDSSVFAVKIGDVAEGQVTLIEAITSKNRKVLKKTMVIRLMGADLLRRVNERGIPPEMEDDAAISAALQRQQLLGHYDVKDMPTRQRMMAYINATFEADPLKSAKVYRAMASTIATLFKVDPNTVKKYYERYLFYGAHRNATCDQHWKKGGVGKKRRGLRVNGEYVMQGRRTDAERIDPNSKLGRLQLRPTMLRRWVKFVSHHAGNLSATITELHERFKLKLVGYNRDKNGDLKYYPIDPRHYPPESSMLEEGQRALVEARIELERRKNDWKRRGRTAQLADGDLDVLDIDGTVAPIYLKFGDDIIQMDGALQPTVLIATDRGSRAIVGWYVTFGNENADAYLASVFSAYTEKERELLRWGVPHLDGMVHGCSSTIFVDRFAGMSQKMQDAIVDRLRRQLLIAEPGNPEGKGDVEGLIGLMLKELGVLEGSGYQEPVKGDRDAKDAARRRNRRRRIDAPKNAVLTIRRFMQALLTAISHHNLTADVSRLRTAAMAAAGVAPVPKEIYLYNKSLRRGDAAWEWTEEKIFRQLSVPFQRTVIEGVITLGKNRTYSSPLLQQRAREYKKRSKVDLVIDGFEMFISPLHLLWDDDGQLELLDATDDAVAVYGDGYKFLHDYLAMLGNADLAKKRYRERAHPTVLVETSQKPVSKAKQKKMAVIDGIQPATKTVRKAVAATLQGQEDGLALFDRLTGNSGEENVTASEWLDFDESAQLLNDDQQISLDW